jgi:acyl-CoA thioesterase-1
LAASGCKAETHNRFTESNTGDASALTAAITNPPAAKATDTSSTAADPRPVIACFGDSLTAGYGVDVESSYPADLQRELDNAGYHYRVVNLGISGETTKDGLARVDRVLAMKPAIVVVEFGGNDGLRGVPVASSRANLDSIVAKLQTSGTQVAMAGITLPPQYSQPYIKNFNETYTLLAKKYRVPLLPFVLQDVYGVPGSIQQDGVHPTAQGCKQVSKNVFGLIKPLLKK